MTTALDVFVPGLPRPQGSMRPIPVGQHVRLVDGGGTNLAAWRFAISEAAAGSWDAHPIDGPVSMMIDFYLPRPASAPKARLYPDRRPDIDKLARAVLDALTGIVFTDDSRVIGVQACKWYAVDSPVGARIRAHRVGAVVPGPGRDGSAERPQRVPAPIPGAGNTPEAS